MYKFPDISHWFDIVDYVEHNNCRKIEINMKKLSHTEINEFCNEFALFICRLRCPSEEWLLKMERAIKGVEVLEMTEIEVNEKGEEIMKKQNKVVKAEELDMHVDNDGIDAVQDNRVVNSDHGIDNRENNLDWWLIHAKNSEMKPVPFRDVLNHFDKGVYKGTIRNVYAYFKFGQRRFVVNVNLEPIYSTAEHRGYVFESCPVFLSFNQFESICNEKKWDFDDMEALKGQPVNIVIDYDETRKSNTYFLQGK